MEDGWWALRGLLGSAVCFSSFWPDSNGFFLSLPPTVAHEHLKERGLFGLPAAGTSASDYYHQMTLMAGHPAPYGDLLMQSGGAASAPHLHDYLNPVDGECWAGVGVGNRIRLTVPSGDEVGAGGSFCLEEAGGRVRGGPSVNTTQKHLMDHQGPRSVVGTADSPKRKKTHVCFHGT